MTRRELFINTIKAKKCLDSYLKNDWIITLPQVTGDITLVKREWINLIANDVLIYPTPFNFKESSLKEYKKNNKIFVYEIAELLETPVGEEGLILLDKIKELLDLREKILDCIDTDGNCIFDNYITIKDYYGTTNRIFVQFSMHECGLVDSTAIYDITSDGNLSLVSTAAYLGTIKSSLERLTPKERYALTYVEEQLTKWLNLLA